MEGKNPESVRQPTRKLLCDFIFSQVKMYHKSINEARNQTKISQTLSV
jgi:hypothetical protein